MGRIGNAIYGTKIGPVNPPNAGLYISPTANIGRLKIIIKQSHAMVTVKTQDGRVVASTRTISIDNSANFTLPYGIYTVAIERISPPPVPPVELHTITIKQIETTYTY